MYRVLLSMIWQPCAGTLGTGRLGIPMGMRGRLVLNTD